MDQTLASNHSPAVIILGCGDLGRTCAREFNVQGISVCGIRRHPPLDPHPHPLFRYKAADISQLESVATDLDQAREIIFCPTPDEMSAAGYRRTYVDSLARLLEYLRVRQESSGAGYPRITFVSSTSVYGQHSGEAVDETSATDAKGYNGQILLEAENLLRAAPLPHLIVRPSGIYSHTRTRLLDRLCKGELSPNHAVTNRIHLDDAARALVYLITRTNLSESLFCLTDHQPATEREIASWLGHLHQSRDETDVVNLSGKAICNQRLTATGFTFLYPSFKEGYGAILAARN